MANIKKEFLNPLFIFLHDAAHLYQYSNIQIKM